MLNSYWSDKERSRTALLTTSIIVVLAGCATTSVFTSYPERIREIKQDIAASRYAEAERTLDKYRNSTDRILYLMEKGRVAFLAKNHKTSIDDFTEVIEAMDRIEEKAKITVTGAAGQGASLLANDNAIPYSGYGYERVFVHNYQALNYVFTGDLEGAGVEVRRANLEQQLALRKHEDEIDRASEGSQARRILNSNRGYEDKMTSLSNLAAEVKNSFQNSYTFYVSAHIYEARREYNNALIDYKKALEIFPNNQYLIANVARLAKRLNIMDDYDRVKNRIKSEQVRFPQKGEGKIVVLYESGYVPQKQEIDIPFSIRSQIQMISLPTYVGGRLASPPLILMDERTVLAETQRIVNVSALAAKALKEKMPAIVLRQISRIILRDQAADASRGSLLGSVANIGHLLLNRADLRSWLTLPADVQIAERIVEAGNRNLKLRVAGYQTSIPLNVKSGRTTLLYVNYVNGQMITHSVTL